MVWSQDAMAQRWRWGRKKVAAFLIELEEDNRITRQRHDRIDVITICNYAQYQSVIKQSGTTNDTTDDTTNHPHPNKGNKGNNITPIVPLPDWVPLDDWMAFQEMRNSIGKPMTGRAANMILKKLQRLNAAPSEILNQSTINNWQDVFELRQQSTNKGAYNAKPDPVTILAAAQKDIAQRFGGASKADELAIDMLSDPKCIR